jgi:hypothetical protein
MGRREAGGGTGALLIIYIYVLHKYCFASIIIDITDAKQI